MASSSSTPKSPLVRLTANGFSMGKSASTPTSSSSSSKTTTPTTHMIPGTIASSKSNNIRANNNYLNNKWGAAAASKATSSTATTMAKNVDTMQKLHHQQHQQLLQMQQQQKQQQHQHQIQQQHQLQQHHQQQQKQQQQQHLKSLNNLNNNSNNESAAAAQPKVNTDKKQQQQQQQQTIVNNNNVSNSNNNHNQNQNQNKNLITTMPTSGNNNQQQQNTVATGSTNVAPHKINVNLDSELVQIKSEPNELDHLQQHQQKEKQQEQNSITPPPPTTTETKLLLDSKKHTQNKTSELTATSDRATPVKTPLPPAPAPAAAAAELSASQSMDNIVAVRPLPVTLNDVNPHIVCNLCFGYLIDATTIVECLHSFCHSCLIKHLRTEKYCPRCEMMINTAKPNIKSDTTLQAIVYKLVPGLYERELMRKRGFYKDHPEQAALATPEQRGDDTEHLIFGPSESMSLSLEYADLNELADAREDYGELLRPRYLQCSAASTVGHLKKFVFGKFEIDSDCFAIDIMYKVKTIVLLDHYTIMDVAYIYTWKRDAPMRFYFRVKESTRPQLKVRRRPVAALKSATSVEKVEMKVNESEENKTNNTQLPGTSELSLLPTTEIKVEEESADEVEEFQVITKMPKDGNVYNSSEALKMVIVNKNPKERSSLSHGSSSSDNGKSPLSTIKHHKEKKNTSDITMKATTSSSSSSSASSPATPKDERKVENIKLKIDLSKQNSVTIINMSDPRREIVKPIRPEKESKSKNKKDKDKDKDKESSHHHRTSSSSSSSSDRKQKTLSPLTVPPLTIKTERITSPNSSASNSPKTPSRQIPTMSPTPSTDPEIEDPKSEFLKSFALTPITSLSPEKLKPVNQSVNTIVTTKPAVNSNAYDKLLMKPPISVAPKSAAASKRKSKEPIKTVAKKPKTSPPLPREDFKIKLPPPVNMMSSASTSNKSSPVTNNKSLKPLMPPPSKPLNAAISRKSSQNKFTPPLPQTPMHQQGIQMAAPGNRTPIAKRYQPILPKSARPNPFASLASNESDASDIKKVLDNEPVIGGTIFAPKKDAIKMGPPPPPPGIVNQKTSNARMSVNSNASNKAANNKTNNYLNIALMNSSKSKGKEAPPGCRTPMYTPNSPIYSPSSPQYVPNYNIPTMPTFKYTPKPSNGNSYLQNVLGGNSSLASLFPAPPTKKDNTVTTTPTINQQNAKLSNNLNGGNKRVYPFNRSPSPIEDGAEKQQVKVKSLLNSCNINIPASLSITLTREDKESSSNSTSYPKHKSPVNNYIEIVKLPDQPSERVEASRRLSPPVSKLLNLPSSIQAPQPPVICQPNQNTSNKIIPSPQHLISRPSLSPLLPPTTPNVFNIKHSAGISNDLKAINPPKSSPPITLPMVNNITNGNNLPTKTTLASPHADKKTPSPEKRTIAQLNAGASHISPPSNENKSSKITNTGVDSQASKKFRPILPRQNPPVSSSSSKTTSATITATTTTANTILKSNSNCSVIGTYSSPSGVAYKVHSNKKVLPPKKSPTQHQKRQTPPVANKVVAPLISPPTIHKINTPPKSPTMAGNTSNANANTSTPPQSMSASQTPAAISAALSKLMPHPTLNPGSTGLSTIKHPNSAAMQAMAAAGLANISTPLGIASNAANQNELSKFLQDNLIRAQVAQAAQAANQSNLFYMGMGHMTPALYNYQQAYMMDQFTRMQRVGTEALNEYLNKLKNGTGVVDTSNIKTGDAIELQSSPMLKPPNATASSPKTSPQPIGSPSSSNTGSSVSVVKSKIK